MSLERGVLETMFPLPSDDGGDKSMPVAEAVRSFVLPGDSIHASHTGSRPCGLILQVAREFAGTDPAFTLSIGGLTNTQHTLVELGLVERLVTSFAAENYPVARPSAVIGRALEAGRLSMENWSLWTLTARLLAGALGLPHLPVGSLRGSSLAAELPEHLYRELEDPFEGGATTAVVAPLKPDVVLLHGVAGDRHGNVVLAGPNGEGPWAALAARRGAVATVERIVPTEELRRHSSLAQVPASAVLSISEAPMGSHPYSLNDPFSGGERAYVEDRDFMVAFERAGRDPDRLASWIERWVTGLADHDGYVEALGGQRVERLRRDARPEAWEEELPEIEAAVRRAPDSYTPEEMMIVAAGRAVARAVAERGHDVVLAGVGVANLAAWMGHAALPEGAAELVAELGIQGYRPRPGEPFVFAQRNVETAKLLTDVTGILGALIGGSTTGSIGVLGAGQVDRTGAINSTRTAGGRFLAGSGGANDIATTADEIVLTVAHGESRLVERVPYVTAPGDRVGTLVTTKAVFARAGGGLVLERLLPAPGAPDGYPPEEVAVGCGWDLDLDPAARSGLQVEPPPTAEELTRLRAFDPRRTFLGRGPSGSGGPAAPEAPR